jgi:tetratricopeptide (TPR) repeat protein
LELRVCILLSLAIALVYLPVIHYKFVNFDDFTYVYGNPHVIPGITWAGVKWAFLTIDDVYWQPLTWLSHMLDCQIFGLNAGGPHAVNVLFHILNTILLYVACRRLRLPIWTSALTSAIFSLHPLRVESVAWVAERKDVLSGFFCLLTVLAYIEYAGKPSKARYSLVAILMFLGLMCKPSLVTVPFMLLLLDFWPLRRIAIPFSRQFATQVQYFWRLVKEKLPLFILAAVSSVITVLGQKKADALAPVPIPLRLSNMLMAYPMYIRKTLLPGHLAVFYPYRTELSSWQVAGAAVLLLGITWVVLAAARKYPYLLFGWLWWLIVPLPMIGLIQAGQQAFADRFTYLAGIGLAIIAACGIADIATRSPINRYAPALVAICVVLVLAGRSKVQVGYWADNFTLYDHALSVTSNNYLAHYNLAYALEESGKTKEAIPHYAESVRIQPNLVQGYYSLGKALYSQGDIQGSEANLRQALNYKPKFAEVHYSLGLVLMREQKIGEAISHLSEALRLDLSPRYAAVCHQVLANLLRGQGKLAEAQVHSESASQAADGDAPLTEAGK